MSYPNFVRGQLFVNIRTLADQIEMLNTHRCVIRKVSRCFGRRLANKTQNEGELINLGGVYLALGPSGSVWNVLEVATDCLGEHVASAGSY